MRRVQAKTGTCFRVVAVTIEYYAAETAGVPVVPVMNWDKSLAMRQVGLGNVQIPHRGTFSVPHGRA